MTKRDYFNFLIVNFPFIYILIPAASAYGVYCIYLAQALGSRIFYIFKKKIKISYLEGMFNFRAPWHVLLLF